MKIKKMIIITFILPIIVQSGSFDVLLAKKDSRISIFGSAGVSFPVSPRLFRSEYKPAMNFGFGLELELSRRLIVRESFNIYSYYPWEQYYRYIQFGSTIIELPGNGIYRGDHDYTVVDLWLDLKYVLKKAGRFAFYVSAGSGVCYMRYVKGGYQGVGGPIKYYGASVHPLVSGGLGVNYKLSGVLSFFFETNYRYNFLKNSSFKTGSIPLRFGISTKI
jgi:hypothetical protein